MVVRINEDDSESVYEVTNSEEKARKIADAENRRMAALKQTSSIRNGSKR